MIWFIKDENNLKEIRFQLNYLPNENKLIIYGQYNILNSWINFINKEYTIENFKLLNLEDILFENYEILLKKIEDYKEIKEKMKDAKFFNIKPDEKK
jgi:hypothetical protein